MQLIETCKVFHDNVIVLNTLSSINIATKYKSLYNNLHIQIHRSNNYYLFFFYFYLIDLIKGEFYKVRIAAYTRYTTGAFTPWVLVKLLGERNNALGGVNTSAIETVSREIYLSNCCSLNQLPHN